MQQKQPNPNQGAGALLGLVGMVGILLWAFIGFIAAIFGALCIIAIIFGGLDLGRFHLSYDMALSFLGFGFAGVIGLPLFLNFAAFSVGERIEPGSLGIEWAIGGYTIGAIAWLFWQLKKEEDEKSASAPAPAIETKAERVPQSAARSYEFASWDDEERRGP